MINYKHSGLLLLLFTIVLTSCGLFPYTLELTVHNKMSGRSDINSLTIYLGPQKNHTGNMKPGHVERLSVDPDLASPRPLNIIYIVGPQKYVWDKLIIRPDKKYILEVHIKENGKIKYRYCIRPCQINQSIFLNDTAHPSS